METAYFYCAVVGGTLLVIQTLLLVLVGEGGDADMDMDVDLDAASAADIATTDSFIKVLSLKTIVAFLTFFGLTGLACLSAELSPTVTLMAAFAAGFAAIYIVANMMSALAKLQSRGNLDLNNAVGQSGRVYLRIPKERSGSGRVTLAVQGRKIEARAVTAGPEIETGAEVVVVSFIGGNTLEVKPLAQT